MKKQTFKNLVSLAQQESPPHVDVADGVISTLTALVYKKPDPYRAYAWVGAASAAMAACILLAATTLWQSSSDSVSEIMTYVSWVAQ
ncbi:MAG: hypothetical protein B6I25_07580 [Planctomycetales bacterium 4572_13]|nr:MAG: hypothetical protein B6I25_07580 [Planctomycetales bacterium 4572_13]